MGGNNSRDNMSYAEAVDFFERVTGKTLCQQCREDPKGPDKFKNCKNDQRNHPSPGKLPNSQHHAADKGNSRWMFSNWWPSNKDQKEEVIYQNCAVCGGNFQKLKTDSSVKCQQ